MDENHRAVTDNTGRQLDRQIDKNVEAMLACYLLDFLSVTELCNL